ncbi:MAG: NTP transferase domain-containing protein [Ignavibacteria bacterium]|nr:NTP transferase domain-containing protein [Ignavibacteria bacterium]
MILAAGFGTRLKPLTESIPKALVPFRNGTMISYQIEKLKSAGIKSITVNAHHLAGQIIEYFRDSDFGIEIEVIIEENILGTGGGIMNAEKFFRDSGNFLAVNVDVYTNLNISQLISGTMNIDSVATLMVQKRKTSRYLEFNEDFELVSRIKTEDIKPNYFAFNGMHVISDRIFDLPHPEGYFDIIDLYLSLIKSRKEIIKGFNCCDSVFYDMGKPEVLNKLNAT